jgi:putative transposase
MPLHAIHNSVVSRLNFSAKALDVRSARLHHRLRHRRRREKAIILSHETVREWEAKLAPILTAELQQRRRGKGRAGWRSWHADETYLKIRGHRCHLNRVIDRNGDLVDTMLSKHRDMAAAKAFFRSAKSATGVVPDRVTTDGHSSYPRAIRSTLDRHVHHRTSAYRNNGLEQDHRGIKGQIRCMRGFNAAERSCRGFDELRAFLRLRSHHRQHVSANRRRLLHLHRASTVLATLRGA